MPFKERNHKFTGQSMSGVNFKGRKLKI